MKGVIMQLLNAILRDGGIVLGVLAKYYTFIYIPINTTEVNKTTKPNSIIVRL